MKLRPLRCLLLAATAGAAAGPSFAAQIECVPINSGTRALAYHGGVESGDGKLFRTRFDECFGGSYRGPMIIDLFSGGGVVTEGLSVAASIVEYGRTRGPISVHVSRGNYCISACTYIFVAGTFRQVAPTASLEPHGFSAFSGSRIDRALAKAVDGKHFQVSGTPVKLSRMVFLAKAIGPLAAADARLAWLHDALRPFAEFKWREGPLIQDLILAYAGWTPHQREALVHLDSVTQLVVTEIERTAAIKAFSLHLDRLAQRPSGDITLGTGREEEHARWMSSEYLKAINGWIAKSRSGAPLKDLGPARESVLAMQAERARDVADSVNQQLWPYLSTRTNAIDVEGFVKLMFSTSILYTRPVTREELCDLNLVNRDCE